MMRWAMLFIGIMLLVVGLPSIGAEERTGTHPAMGRDADHAPMASSITNMTMSMEMMPLSEPRGSEGPGPAEVPCISGDCPSATAVVTIGVSD